MSGEVFQGYWMLCILKIILTHDTIFMFYDHKICPKKWSVMLSGFVINFFLLLYINCILVTRIPVDGQGGVWNMLLINSMWLCIFVIVHVLGCHYVNNIRACHSSAEDDESLLRIWGCVDWYIATVIQEELYLSSPVRILNMDTAISAVNMASYLKWLWSS
jgi:hypothetical protein